MQAKCGSVAVLFSSYTQESRNADAVPKIKNFDFVSKTLPNADVALLLEKIR